MGKPWTEEQRANIRALIAARVKAGVGWGRKKGCKVVKGKVMPAGLAFTAGSTGVGENAAPATPTNPNQNEQAGSQNEQETVPRVEF